MHRILLIDNYDSFTYNLAQALWALDAEVIVRRNDEVTLDEAEAMSLTHIVISPGPGRPDDAGISMPMIARFAGRVPVLGVCLGHQAIAQVYGARIVRAAHLMHGKSSTVHHDGTGLYAGLPDAFEAGRYHSLTIEEASLPPVLRVMCRSDDGTIMGVRHTDLEVEGVQFHPESILTSDGPRLLGNFLKRMCERAVCLG